MFSFSTIQRPSLKLIARKLIIKIECAFDLKKCCGEDLGEITR